MAREDKGKKEAQAEQPDFFRELGSFMKPYNGLFTGSVIISIMGVGANVASYAFLGKTAEKLFSGMLTGIWTVAIVAGLLRIACQIFMNLSTWMSHRAAYRTLRDIRLALSEKMLRLPMGYFEENGSGRIKHLMTDQVEDMEKPLAHVLPEMTADMLVPLALIVWLFVIDWRLGLTVTLWIMIGFSVTGGMMKDYPERLKGQIETDKAMNQAITEYVGGIEVIKNFGQAERACTKLENAVTAHRDYNVGWQRDTLIWSSLGMAIAPFSIFPVLIAGLIFCGNGSLEASELVLSVLLSMGIFGPLMAASGYMDQLAGMGTAAKEIRDILDYAELKRGEEKEPGSADIEFRNVSFSYGRKDTLALDDVSFRVPEGTMLALVGPSGSGKSTIAKLLAGYWDAGKGDILIGGKSITSMDQEALNRMIAYVEQDTFLFDDTIMENIRKGNPDATDSEIIENAKKAGCHDFIAALPEGYQTKAGIAGKRLSGGEKQRIAILRAMMKDAPILVLDEATASADPENEARIQEALSVIAKGRTLVVVAHHLRTTVHADQIAYVEGGRIREIGKHDELLERSEGYRTLWNDTEEA